MKGRDFFFDGIGMAGVLLIKIDADQCGNSVRSTVDDDFGKNEDDGSVLYGESDEIADFLLTLLELYQKVEVILALLY